MTTKKSIILSLLAIVAFILPFTTFAGKLEAKHGVAKDGYNFWFYEPDKAANEAKPIVIFLHGQSLCGNDLNKVKRYGTINAIEKGRTIDAYVVAPQNPGGSWSPSKVMKVVDWVKKNHKVDESKIYVLGMSLGGYGAIDLAAAYPDEIAAAMAFCGGGTSKNISDLNKVPLWIVHGTGDRSVPISASDNVVSKMKASNPKTPRLHYDRVPGMGHSEPARYFYLDDSYDWLLSHSLNDPGRPVSPKFDIVGQSKYAYSGLNHNRSNSKASYAKASSSSKSTATSSKSKSSKNKSTSKAKTSTKAKSKTNVKAKK